MSCQCQGKEKEESEVTQAWINKELDFFRFDFDEAVRNKGGPLSLTDINIILRNKGYRDSLEKIENIFKFFDVDMSKGVTKEEFNKVMTKLPKMTLKEFALRNMFTALDVDKSGYITLPELEYAITKESHAMGLPQDIIAHVKQLIAKDDDNKLDYEEFIRDFKLETEAREIRDLFVELDKDKNGFLTREEIARASEGVFEVKLADCKIDDVLNKLKKDADGKFSYEEFIQAWRQEKAKYMYQAKK